MGLPEGPCGLINRYSKRLSNEFVQLEEKALKQFWQCGDKHLKNSACARSSPGRYNGFIYIHELWSPSSSSFSITIIKDKGKVRGERKINFKGPNCKHNLQFVNCLETFGGRIKEMKSRTYRNIAV